MVLLTIVLFISISFCGLCNTSISKMNSQKRTLLQECPNSCSNNGVCKGNRCECNPRLGGIDCSIPCPLTCAIPGQSICDDVYDYSTYPNGGPTWECLCDVGYYKTVSGTCTDTNYCLNNTCDTEATCLSNPPSYNCTCNPGFSGDGSMGNCHDIDECTLDTHNCNRNAECINLVPFFTCRCISPWKGDGIICSLTAGNTSAVYSPSTKIQPQFLCYTQNTTTWHAYLAYHSILLTDQSIPITNSNNLVATTTTQSYPGQTSYFMSGRHLAFMVTNPVVTGGNYVKWTLDGNYLGVFSNINNWSSYLCPLDITINIPINTKCPAVISNLQNSISNNLKTFLSNIKSSRGIMTSGESVQVVVTLPSTCTINLASISSANGVVSATVSSAPSVKTNSSSGASAMDLVFQSVVDGSILDILDSTTATVVPKVLADEATIDTSNFNIMVGNPVATITPPSQSTTNIDAFGDEVSWFSFVMVIVPLALVLIIIVVVIAVCIWARRSRAKSSLV